MQYIIRGALILWSLALLALTAGFVLQAPWALWLWPWPDGRLSYLWVGSILAAVALPILWIGAKGELAAMRAGALDFALSFAGIAAFLTWLHPAEGLTPWVVGAWLALAANLAIWLAVRRLPFRDTRPVPGLVRGAFLALGLVLIGVGTALLLCLPAVFPWPLKPETSVLIGWVFLGAAVYLLHGFVYPLRGNVSGQLAGFAAYDLVLLVPFIQHFETVKPEHLPSLAVFTGVLVATLLLAIYYFTGPLPEPDGADRAHGMG